MDIEKSAGVIIFYLEDNEPYFLLLEYATYWGFVRGRIERKEDLKETVKREAKEEANLSGIKIIDGFEEHQSWFYRLKGKLRKKFAVYFLAEVPRGESKKARVSFEHKSFKFLQLKEALEIMRIQNEKAMLEKAYKFIKEKQKQTKLV